MDRGYASFGLALRSSFALPGMALADGGEALSLGLGLETQAELEEAWSGARAAKPWRGLLGDDRELTIEWGVDGDLLFDYVGEARFRLDPDRTRLGCAPRDSAAIEWKRVLLSRILPNVSLARGREALHASAVETSTGVVAIAAPSGTGKSTLAAELIGRGSALFADDVLVLGREQAGTVEAHPGGPHMSIGREAGAKQIEGLGAVLASFPGEHWIEARHASSRPRRVAAIALLRREPGLPLEAEAISSSPLALAPYMLGLPDDEPGRDVRRFELYSDLVESTRLLRLTGDSDDTPAALANTLESALEPSPHTMRSVA
jgi:hypothetical protein